jgi:hypothetical protein
MKYNLIFENISEETFDPPAAENTENSVYILTGK